MFELIARTRKQKREYAHYLLKNYKKKEECFS